MKEVKLPQVKQDSPGIVGTFHPEGASFSNTEELMHWITTGEVKTILKKTWNQDNRPISQRF